MGNATETMSLPKTLKQNVVVTTLEHRCAAIQFASHQANDRLTLLDSELASTKLQTTEFQQHIHRLSNGLTAADARGSKLMKVIDSLRTREDTALKKNHQYAKMNVSLQGECERLLVENKRLRANIAFSNDLLQQKDELISKHQCSS
jgi:chromosome segregation ATPase